MKSGEQLVIEAGRYSERAVQTFLGRYFADDSERLNRATLRGELESLVRVAYMAGAAEVREGLL